MSRLSGGCIHTCLKQPQRLTLCIGCCACFGSRLASGWLDAIHELNRVIPFETAMGSFALLALWAVGALAGTSPQCETPAAGASLLSTKVTTDRVTTDRVGEVSAKATNVTNQTLNESLPHLVKDNLATDADRTNDMPGVNLTDSLNHHGFEALVKPFEFLYYKVAQLETAIALQNTEIQVLSQQLDAKAQEVASLTAIKEYYQKKDKDLDEVVQKAVLTERAAQRKQQEQKEQKKKDLAVEILRQVFRKNAHQHSKGFQTPVPASLLQKAASSAGAGGSSGSNSSALALRAEGRGQAAALDSSVTAKAFDAVSDAYNAASDKASFVAGEVIDTVEHAMAILVNGFDISANCDGTTWPSAGADSNGAHIDFGRQKCSFTLVGETITLFDFNFGRKSFGWPGAISDIVKLGSNIVDIAKIVGQKLLDYVPPFSYLNLLEKVIQEFVTHFAYMASKVIEKALGEGTSLLQEASRGEFPKAGAAPQVRQLRRNLAVHTFSRKLPEENPTASASPEGPAQSLLQKTSRGDDDVDGALGFAPADYVPNWQKLITQFNGVETDSGSCLAFAPQVRGNSDNKVRQRDWQTPGQQSDHNVPSEFIKLEPWAVPCDPTWAKQNPSKWQGYSFYTWPSPVERCMTVAYSLAVQPVLAFVGGLEFDLLPSPLAEVETMVCWPDTQPDGVDLSAIEMHISSGGVPLLTRTIRLKKRFGSNTDFTPANTHMTTASGRVYFGVVENGGDDSGLNAMDRDSLLQKNATKAKAKVPKAKPEFVLEEKDHMLSSMIYDHDMGYKLRETYRGKAAARKMKPLFGKRLEVLQSNATEQAHNHEHELFELASPSNGVIGFSIKGLVTAAALELAVQMKFGPITTPEKRITIMNLVSQLQIVLAAIPFISADSKLKAIAALTDFDPETAVPQVPEGSLTGSTLTQYWLVAANDNRAHGKMVYLDGSLSSAPFWEDASAKLRLIPDDDGEYWLVTGETHKNPNRMIYIAGSGNSGNFGHFEFNKDPHCKWRLEAAGDGKYWLVTSSSHHVPNKMLDVGSDGSFRNWNFWHDPKTKFHFVPDTIRGIHPVQLSPAKVWIVAGEGQGDGKGKMIYPETGGSGVHSWPWHPDTAALWKLVPDADGSEFWLVAEG
ncbi:unnamed protein product, partial [Effrenium voratum]